MESLRYFSFGGSEPIYIDNIRLSTGQIRTDPSSWTEEELSDVGATGPYYKPSYDELTEELKWDVDSLQWNITPKKVTAILEVDIWIQIRSQRNAKLLDTDQLMYSDYPITESEKDNLLEYRRLLRDLPSTITDPYTANWPSPPQCIINHFNLG